MEGLAEDMYTDTDIFLHPLRRLSPPPPANSRAKPACSDTLPEAGYARSCDEKCPTVLCACPPASLRISFTTNGATADAALFLYWNIFLFRYRITE